MSLCVCGCMLALFLFTRMKEEEDFSKVIIANEPIWASGQAPEIESTSRESRRTEAITMQHVFATERQHEWLLIVGDDRYVCCSKKTHPPSFASDRTLEEIFGICFVLNITLVATQIRFPSSIFDQHGRVRSLC